MKFSKTINYVLCAQLLALSSSAVAVQTCDNNEAITTPNARFVVNADGTVLDTRTRLMWKHCSEGLSGSACSSGSLSSVNWENAILAAKNSNFAGHTDWRLPNIKELASIIERSCRNPAINATVFPVTDSAVYWTATPSFSFANQSFQVEFFDGDDTFELRNTNARVRLVRYAN